MPHRAPTHPRPAAPPTGEGEEALSQASGSAALSTGDAFPFRAFAVGTALCLVIGMGCPYVLHKMRGSYMALDFGTPAAIFLFFLLVFVVNGVLRWFGVALRAGELLVVYIMMIVATTIPTMGLTASFIPDIAAEYYASTENRWDELIVPYLPEWVRPTERRAIQWLFEGVPRGEAIPWAAWVAPIGLWLTFLGALYLVMVATMVMVRRQWVDRERLVYPLVQLPLEMVKGEATPGFSIPFLRSGWMWAGLAIPLFVVSMNGLNFYNPAIPRIDQGTSLEILGGAGRLKFHISFPMLGFAYMLRLDMALSLWFFSLVTQFERAAFKRFGFAGFVSAENFVRHLDGYSANGGGPLVCHQSLGALLTLVVFGLWVSRRHLADVVGKACGWRKDVDDSREIMSYRFAFWGTLVAVAYMILWLNHTGMPLGTAAVMVLLSLAIFYGITRIVAGGGLAATRAPVIPSTAILSVTGSESVSPATMVAFGLTYVWMADVRTFVMASAANGLKIASGLAGRRRRLLWGIAIAVLTAALGSIYVTMAIAYDIGGANANPWFFRGGPQYPYNFLTSVMLNRSGPDSDAMIFAGLGAAAMTGLTVLHLRFPWWPLHPMGFPLSTIMLTDHIWFSVLLAWLVKRLVLAYGGPRVYRKTRLFFLGLILGQFVACGLWIVVDLCTGRVGNNLYWV